MDPETPARRGQRPGSATVRTFNMENDNVVDPAPASAVGAAPAVNGTQALSGEWCANPMTADFDPGTLQGQKTFESKTRSLLEERNLKLL